MQDFIDKLNKEFKGYHIELNLHPAGGLIDVSGCDECGTCDESSFHSIWRHNKGKINTIDDAIRDIQKRIKIEQDNDKQKITM